MIFMYAFIALCVLMVKFALSLRKVKRWMKAQELREKSYICRFCDNKTKCPDAVLSVPNLCVRYRQTSLCETCMYESICDDLKDGLVGCSQYEEVVTQSPAPAPAQLQH